MPVPDNCIHVGWRWANRFIAKTMRAFMLEGDPNLPSPAWMAQMIHEAYSAGWDACRDHVRAIVDDPMNTTYVFAPPTCPRCGHREAIWRDGHLDFSSDEEGCLPVATVEHFRCKTCDHEFTVREPIPEEPL
jgi:hypothetical protein